MNAYNKMEIYAKALLLSMEKAYQITQKDPNALGKGLELIKDAVFSLISFYKNNETAVDQTEEEMNELTERWNFFVHLLQEAQKKEQFTERDTLALGTALESVRQSGDLLLAKISLCMPSSTNIQFN